MITVLKLIHDNTGGQPSLCKRVFTKSHWTYQNGSAIEHSIVASPERDDIRIATTRFQS